MLSASSSAALRTSPGRRGEKNPGRGEEKSPGREEEKSPRRPPSPSPPTGPPSPPPTAKSRGASRWKGQASGTRASATQLPWERDPHKAPKLGIPPGAVSPAMCRRLSGHAILCSQGKWGRGGVPRSVPWDFSAQSGGASNLPSPWERPGVGSKDILLFFGQTENSLIAQRELMCRRGGGVSAVALSVRRVVLSPERLASALESAEAVASVPRPCGAA